MSLIQTAVGNYLNRKMNLGDFNDSIEYGKKMQIEISERFKDPNQYKANIDAFYQSYNAINKTGEE